MLRIGTVPYLVARPLTWGLDARGDVELRIAPPAELASLLARGELDVALASSILCDRVQGEAGAGFRLWTEGPVIAARGAIRSVLLFLRPGLCGPRSVERLCTDAHSRTGRALARILLRDAFEATFEECPADRGEDPFESGADAVQLIGDPALEALVDREDWNPLDLGETWVSLTRRPFVYAGWIGRPGFDPARAEGPLLAAAHEGLAARLTLVEEGVASLGHEAAFLHRYLFEDLAYRLPAAEVESALEEFGRRLARHPEPAAPVAPARHAGGSLRAVPRRFGGDPSPPGR